MQKISRLVSHGVAITPCRCSFMKKSRRLVRYLGDLVLAATDTWSCSVGLVGTLEIFFVFVQAERIAGGKGAIALAIRAIRAIEIKIRAIDHFKK